MKGIPVENIIVKFYGDLTRWPEDNRPNIVAVAEHIHRTGDCLWHAQSTVLGKLSTCPCAICTKSCMYMMGVSGVCGRRTYGGKPYCETHSRKIEEFLRLELPR